DQDMWHHASTRENLKTIESFGTEIIPVEKGELASGLYGDGRMAEPETIIHFVVEQFFLTKTLAGKRAFVLGGATYEPIDPVLFIGNYSSGKMGIAIAKELYRRGADVVLVSGPTKVEVLNGID